MRNHLAMQTDFSMATGAVGVMHGVAYQVDPGLVVDDISHDLPKFNPYAASYNLLYELPYWPKGTVFVSVVDPGVGTSRRACVAETNNGCYIVTPDNGTLTHVLKNIGIRRVREIDETINRYPGTEGINIFHGRDLFAYCGARLASGQIDMGGVGPEYPVSEIVTIDLPEAKAEDGQISGYIECCNPNFGIVVTSIPVALLAEIGVNLGDAVHVCVGQGSVPRFEGVVHYERSFGFVPPGAPVIYAAEGMKLGMGLNQGDFARTYGIGIGPKWEVTIKKI